MSRLLSCLTLLVLMFIAGLVSADPAQTLDQGWEYRWGDSPFQQHTPLWTTEDAPHNWKPIDFPSNPPDRNGQHNAWYRITLPEGQFTDPVVYIYSIDLIAEVYLGSELIYKFGEFDAEGKGHFIGWPWHMIDLPENYADQTLHFRIFSDYTDIGLWGEVKIIERSELLIFILSKSYASLIIAAFCLFIAMLAMAFALIQREQKQFLYLSLFSLAACGKLLGETQAVQLVLDAPFLRTYLTAVAYYSMPIWIALLLREWLPSSKSRWMSAIALYHAGYLILALGAAAFGWIHLSITYPIFDLLFTVSLILLLYRVTGQFKHMDLTQRGVILSFSAFAFLLLIDMAVAHGFLPWGRVPLSIGALLFASSLIAIFLRDYAMTQRMVHQLNTALEQRVQERTAKLETYVEKEKRYSEQLMKIQAYDQRLDKLIHQLQKITPFQAQQTFLCTELKKLLDPIKLQVTAVDMSQSYIAQADSHLTHYVIYVKDINQQMIPCLNFHLEDESVRNGFSEPLLDDLIQRILDKVSFTLSSKVMLDALERMSFEDFLTGLKNRRYFDQALEREISLAERHQHPLAMLICDIDHFKQFNDNFGHESGDEALKQVAKVLQEHFRETDIPCRYGGEEFVLIMPQADVDSAMQRGEALRQRIETLNIEGDEQNTLGHISISIGLAVWPTTTSDPKSLLNDADRALYRAKHSGRNRIEIAETLA